MFVKIKNCNPKDYYNDINKQSAIQSFLEAHGERKHIIYCPKKTCQEIVTSGLFGNVHNKYSSDLLDLKNEIGTLKNNVSVDLTIDFSLEKENITSSIINNRFEITSSYHYLLSASFKNKCTFLAEDDSDCEFFTLIAKTITKLRFGKNISLSFNNLEGGGSRTHKKYKRMLSDKSFGICILDNDKKHPLGAEGDTSKAFKLDREQRGYAVNQECIVLDFHEAECVVPHEILINVVDKSKIDTLDKIEIYDRHKEYQFRRYFDHKKGINLAKSWDLDSIYNYEFWEPFFVQEPLFQTKPCRQIKKCINVKTNIQCENCINIDGLGEKILVESIDEMKKVHLRPIYNRLTPHIKSQWDFIGQKLLDWGCVLSLPPIKSF
ncbi:hypothetical protein [Vibrio crassostreae]|uniref:Uncharacterized protein n=1 Tax=Vibrio crassostreae TaxID=246167 RepID=A0ABP1WW71_9VIBR|nr:hypothetical protein [Vibrio crassostreae]MDH5952712.1 hypothetical protein [Vibrio crassostreae]CAK1758994.1 conserved hypothetical protein [Vibrio crassostreae]CAK1768187.1 conserved hypothetical protein [Vibrio crassostreae]CAK1812525.1 conserved hypothetical protein [Vibrio crassostreae]CAK2161740.1 conserved hypothetical protein [Vibrio crassostreae]